MLFLPHKVLLNLCEQYSVGVDTHAVMQLYLIYFVINHQVAQIKIYQHNKLKLIFKVAENWTEVNSEYPIIVFKSGFSVVTMNSCSLLDFIEQFQK